MTNPSRNARTLSVFSLEGKNCLVTGGAGGLGKECITAFMLSGANCACVDLSFDACKSAIDGVFAAVLHETGSEPGKMHAYACNAVVEKEVEATVAQVVRDFGQIDVLVTCAGICINGSAEETDLATWRKVLQVNLDGTYLFASIVGKHMLEQKVKGSMILVSSAGATHPPRPQHQASYNASKSGVNALAVSLATEWAYRGIRVNTFSPGFMTTPLMSKTSGQGDSQAPLTDIQKQWLTQIPMGRFANPDEHRGTLVWMASSASSYLTGADIVVDGAWTHW